MGARDSGWIQIYCENAQEVYESIILAVRIAEHPDIRLPVMVCQDGFITSHALETLNTFSDKKVKEFIGKYSFNYSLLDVDNPVTFGPLDLYDYYFEHKRQQVEAMDNVLTRMPDIFTEFNKTFEKEYSFIESYKLDDADIAVIALSSTAGTVKEVIDKLRENGIKAGLLKPRFVRPFPADEIRKALSGTKAVGIMDRSDTFSLQGGPLFHAVRSCLYDIDTDNRPKTLNYIFGLGGRDMSPVLIKDILQSIQEAVETNEIKNKVSYVGVRE
jgi:pyruvate ferredoxin oxidoreductase alpha subunit